MCGIYTIASCPEGVTLLPDKKFFTALESILKYNPALRQADKLRPPMIVLKESTSLFVRMDPQLTILNESTLREKLVISVYFLLL